MTRRYATQVLVVTTAVLFCAAAQAASRKGQGMTDAETMRRLPEAWREVKHLPNGFPADFHPELVSKVPDGKGGTLDLSAKPTPDELAALKDRCIKGNITHKSGEKVYHIPGCPDYHASKISESSGERLFSTEEEAQAAGWRKASNCP